MYTINTQIIQNEYKNNMFYTFEYKGDKYKMTNSYLKEFKTKLINIRDLTTEYNIDNTEIDILKIQLKNMNKKKKN